MALTSAGASQAAKGAAETAQGAAERAKNGAETAKTGAESAKTAAETSARNAAASENNAQTHATQAARDAERAAASAQEAKDAIDTHAAEIYKLKQDLTAANTALAEQQRINADQSLEIEKLQAAAEGNLYMFKQDATEAYEKTVPADAMKWATLDRVGGRTLVWNLTKPEGIKEMKRISDAGLAREFYSVGDQITVTYEDSNGNIYDMPWDIVHIGDAKLADGTIKKDAIYLQSHYTTVEGVQWDKEEKEIATEETAQEGLFYYVPNGGGFKLLDIAVGATIPYADYENKVYHNAIKDTTGNICRYGYNRETHAAMPQWLNSTAAKGAWWTAKHVGDVAPDQHGSVRGFMAGLPADFVNCMEGLTITQALNTVSEPDKTLGKESYTAKIFLPRMEQMYVKNQIAGVEGEAWDYYKQLAQSAGLTGVFQWEPTAYDVLKSYALENHSSALSVRLASAYRGYSYKTWSVNSSGNVSGGNAYNAYRCRPACVI